MTLGGIMFIETVGYQSRSKIRAGIFSISKYPTHVHPNALEILCVLEGNVRISDTMLKQRLSEGDLYFFSMRNAHQISSAGDKNLLLYLQLDLNYYKRYFKDIDKAYFVCDSFIRKNQMSNKLNYMRFLLARIYFAYNDESTSDSTLEDMGKELLSFLLAHFQFYTYKIEKGRSIKAVQPSDIRPNDPYFLRIYRIIDYIFDHCTEKLKLEDIAAQEYLSVSYLSRYIKKACGLSFTELLSMARCEEAQRLLGASRDTVDQIASLVGFANRKHLSSQFRKWFGITPTEYRRRLEDQYNRPNQIFFLPYEEEAAERILRKYLI
jgi:xylan 1,4-beta-xylosidase